MILIYSCHRNYLLDEPNRQDLPRGSGRVPPHVPRALRQEGRQEEKDRGQRHGGAGGGGVSVYDIQAAGGQVPAPAQGGPAARGAVGGPELQDEPAAERPGGDQQTVRRVVLLPPHQLQLPAQPRALRPVLPGHREQDQRPVSPLRLADQEYPHT